MLDRAKLAQELQRMAGSLFVDSSADLELARDVWNQIAHDETLASRVSAIVASFSVPSWQGMLGQRLVVETQCPSYQVLSIDGSQIYPDRHQGPGCFLINIGSIMLRYGARSRVAFHSQPYLFNAYDENHQLASTDLVNCRRQELEFSEGLLLGMRCRQEYGRNEPFLLLFDGSLIFWLLESKDSTLQDRFLQSYVNALDNLYREQIPVAGYVSLPHSRELVNVLRLAAADFDPKKAESYVFDRVFDGTVASFFLRPGERTSVFQNNATISEQYPAHVRPYFFYLNVGSEIGRVEIPQWIALDEQRVNSIATIIADQSQKGFGYPIALAEAHEAAVVKGPDRDFFYHLLDKMSVGNQSSMVISQKSKRKRHVGV